MKSGVIKGAILGGVVVFIWMLVAWMVLPWSGASMRKFKCESEVTEMMMRNCPRDGVYMFPFKDDGVNQSPYVLATVKLNGNPLNPWAFISSLVTQIVGVGMIGYLLSKTRRMTYPGRVAFVTLAGIAVWVLGIVPEWTWCALPAAFVLNLLVNYGIGYFLAGLVVAKCVRAE
ncbi:MAG: hypothetical protein KBC64_04850 [Simkaniaceae bacterium]|nr:hypothetical protein [Simkaniaceae bacterium]